MSAPWEVPGPNREDDDCARCTGCQERLDATHQPACGRGEGAVLREHVEPV